MSKAIIYQSVLIVLMCIFLPALAKQVDKSNCYPITLNDIRDENAPTFEEFPVDAIKIERPAPLDLTSNPLAKKFMTVLRIGASKGPNFAGHYTIVAWGAGTSTLTFAIVDAKTGKVISSSQFSTLYFLECVIPPIFSIILRRAQEVITSVFFLRQKAVYLLLLEPLMRMKTVKVHFISSSKMRDLNQFIRQKLSSGGTIKLLSPPLRCCAVGTAEGIAHISQGGIS